MPPPVLVPLDEMIARLETTLEASPADATEIVWVEARRGQESNGKRRRDSYELQERTVLVRVRESGRYGIHRANVCEVSDLAKAVREALAVARLAQPEPLALRPERADAALEPSSGLHPLHDPEIARMNPARARELVQRLGEGSDRGETVRLGWAETRMAVANSRGLRRAAEATTAWAAVSTGRSIGASGASGAGGAGFASAASRSLAGLALSVLLARARQRQAPPDLEAAPPPEPADGPVPLVLSQEAAAGLLGLLNRRALTSSSFRDGFHDGTSLFRGALGGHPDNRLFHAALSLRDDATDPRGLPFPFDLLGSAKRPLDLVDKGVFLTPAVDDRLARELDRPPTPHLVAPDEASPSHLFLLPGNHSGATGGADSELLRAAEGGLWIGALDSIEDFDPGSLRFRAIARGVRRIQGSVLSQAAPVPDLIWEDDLRSLLSAVLGVGTEPVTQIQGDGLFGGITTPLLAFERAEGRFAPA